jgi:ribosome-binding protein aMBF1 (putative translation factor)
MSSDRTSFGAHVAEIEARLDTVDRSFLDTVRHQYGLSRQVVELRRSRGLSQEEVAARAGLDQREISRLERGSGYLTRVTLEKVACALHAHLPLVTDPGEESAGP